MVFGTLMSHFRGVVRGGGWGIGPEGGKAFSSQYICRTIPSVRLSIRGEGLRTYVRTEGMVLHMCREEKALPPSGLMPQPPPLTTPLKWGIRVPMTTNALASVHPFFVPVSLSFILLFIHSFC